VAVPAFTQMLIFYALFMFCLTSFALRQNHFMAEDFIVVMILFSFDLPCDSVYGDHVSLFPILASIYFFLLHDDDNGSKICHNS
jgi:YidC/Oxa1 family membrane protein insertase